MTADVTSIHGAIIDSARKRGFVEWAAGAFDLYVEKTGAEPEGMVLVYGGITQQTRLAFMGEGVTQDGMTSLLALAQATIQKRITLGPNGDPT